MKNNLNIAMILDNEFTGDMRVENEVIALQEAGHQVFVLCLNHGNKPPEEDFHGAKIIRLPLSKWRTKKMRALVNSFFDPYTLFWKKELIKLFKVYQIDAIHAHDLYLVGAALKARRSNKRQIRVVADLHENYPHALKNYKFTNKFPGKYIISIKKWEKTEIEWLNEVDHIITVIEEAVDRYTSLGINPKKIHVVPNYVNAAEFLDKTGLPEIKEPNTAEPTALYIGGFDLHRGLESVVRALPAINKEFPNFKLTLVGTGSNEEDLKQLAAELGVTQKIEFMGWRKPAELPGLIKKATLCLIPHLKSIHTDHTIPHKLFHYMIMGKPVLVSNCKPLERIVKETGAGEVFQSNNPSDFAEKVQKLLGNTQRLKSMGEKGQKAVLKTYNWEDGKAQLLNLYNTTSED
ncbi:MAG: glycosyltransferase family 1 protein [Saprospirales bacterium]|nr:MAG: glycosyltransferase family 1 protein [Saprospirales bacterium]